MSEAITKGVVMVALESVFISLFSDLQRGIKDLNFTDNFESRKAE